MVELLEAARAVASRAQAAAGTTEADRRVATELVDEMRGAGIFAMLLPRALGGSETDPLTVLDAIEILARGDGSAGWIAMIGATTNAVAGYLPEAGARRVFTGPGVVTGGTFNPLGRAEPVEGGLVVSGRWPYGSGVQHSDWMCGACVVPEPGGRAAPGRPDTRLAFFPAEAVRVHDTWDAAGLRGTASHDFAVEDLFVPASHATTFDFRAWPDGALWRMPPFALLFPPMAAVPLGIARAAIDELVSIAPAKVPYRSARRLAERDMAQVAVARAEALTRSARAFLREAVAEVWDAAVDGRAATLSQRAMCRLAGVHAARSAREAVTLCFEAAGGSAVYASSPLQRHLRDTHTAAQHVVLAASGYETAGRVLFGLPPDTLLI